MSKSHRVLTKQQRYKTYHDRKPGVKSIDVKIGDHVRVKNPRHVEVVKVNGTCVTLKGGRKWNMSRIVKCTTAFNHVPHPQHNNNDSLLHMDIPCNNKQQALPEQGPNTTVPNSPVHEATRKSSRVKRVPRRLLE